MNDSQAVLAVLENTPALLIPLMREIPEPLRKRRPQPGKWSAHEHFCHLATQHPPMLERLEKMLAEDDPALLPLNPSPEEESGAYLDMDLDEAAGRFVQERMELVTRLRSLAPEDWDRTGRHPDLEGYTVFRLARQIALHDMLHGFRIEETLYRKDWPEEQPRPLQVEQGIPGSLERMQPGQINLLGPFETPGLTPRLIRVYLPRNYDPTRASFALYMFDGQNVFDDAPSFSGGWFAHEAVEKLARSKRSVPVVIGIDHGGAGRNRELSPFSFDMEQGQIPKLLDWVTTRLMPALTAELNLVPGPLGAVVGGSSMGGLAALWSHFRYPEAFGGALVMSPSFWLADEAIFHFIASRPNPAVSRVYMDAGAREDKGKVVDVVKRMAEHLVARGYDADRLMWRADPKGAHSEADWRRRLPKALRFMYQRI
ncbi:MAG TPA: alpha/beta hydrolase-fold protein [Thermoanaerobaculia bacterium]|nr:alpha/beta hydrolase-fold protein [Thermoanaerobaculia bacterium]